MGRTLDHQIEKSDFGDPNMAIFLKTVAILAGDKACKVFVENGENLLNGNIFLKLSGYRKL